MATASEDNLFFYEDEVFRVNSKGVIQFGTVIENSELVSSDDETSDDEYDSSDYKIKKGHIRVSWHPSGLTQVLSESKVGLADRSLMPGDVVKMLAADKNTQRGYCNNIKVYATVQIVGTQQVIENIPTSQLSPLSKFTKDLAVYLDHWVGVIRDVHIKLLIACSDGSRAYISDSNTLKALLSRQGLGNYKSADDDDSPRMGKPDFYPGQALVAPRFILNSAVTGWQNKSPEFDRLVSRSKSLNVKVEAVEVDYVEVAWRCTAYTGNSVDPREPIVKGEELGRLCVLNHFESATNEVGDRATYVVTSEDVVTSLDSWRERKKEKLAEESGRRLPVQHTRRKGSRRKLKKSKQESGLPALPTTLASYPNQDPSEQEMPLCPLGGDSSDPTRIEEDSSQQSTISNPANDLNSTLVAKDQAAQSSSVALESECCNGTLVSSVELEDKCSNETLVPVQAGNEQDVPLILLDVASDSEDCWEWTTDEEDYYSGDDSTSCCTTYTGTSVATSSITALTNSEPSLQAPLGQDETGAPTTSESSAVAGTGTELTPRPKRRVLTWTTRLSRLRNKKKSRRGGAGNKLKALPCRGGAEVEDWVGRQCVVEILCTQSTADVVWQDGTAGQNISSMNLYPIHYLDEKEFFPGDFVVRATEDEEEGGGGSPAGEYGVVKQMDHAGRTARVQWFNITITEGQSPQYLGESEMSVYDLKDHPDFQFRPGSVVMSMGGVTPSLDRAESNNTRSKATKSVPVASQSVMSTCDDGVENSSPSPNPVPQLKINGAICLNNCASKPKTSPSPAPNVEPSSNTPPSNDGRLMDSTLSNAADRSTSAASLSNTTRLTTTSCTNTSENGTNTTDAMKTSTNTSVNSTDTTDTSTNESIQSKPDDEKEEERVYVGQVLDNFPEGRIKVWWVDGSICSVWPQDLYKIGDYNSDEGELWASSSEGGDSWETETESEEEFENLDETFPTVEALALDSAEQPLLEELFVKQSALLAALASNFTDPVSSPRRDSVVSNANTANTENRTEAREDSVRLVKEGDVGVTGCDASVDEFHCKLFRTIYRLSHVLNLLIQDLDKPPLTYSLSIVSAILTGAYKNLTYLDKLLEPLQFSSVELEAVLFSMSIIERLNTELKPDTVIDAKSGSESNAETGSTSEVKTGSKSQEGSQLNAETGAKPESKPDFESIAQTGGRFKVKVKTDSELQITQSLRDVGNTVVELITSMLKTHAIDAAETGSKPKLKTGSAETSVETGSKPKLKTGSAGTSVVVTIGSNEKEMVADWPSFTEITGIIMVNNSGQVTNEFLSAFQSSCWQSVQKLEAEMHSYDAGSCLPRMFLSLGSRCCAMLCSQLLRAHDEFVVKFLPHHNGQLRLFSDIPYPDQHLLLSGNLNQYQVFQANLKYLKSKLNPKVTEPSSVQPKVNAEELVNDLVDNVIDQSESSVQSSELKKLELNHEEEEIKERDDRLPSIELCSEPAPLPPPSSNNDSSERAPTSGSEPSPEPFNPSVPNCPPSSDSFVMLESVDTYPHKYAKRASFVGPNSKLFFKALRKEMAVLRSSLPPGIWVRGFEDRMDLLSIMIEGPARTPYQDGLFHFDLYLPAEFPQSPPICHYLSYASERLNPNLYETGKVCVSLLGTWSGRGTEVWTPQSTLLQILISIQGLILNAEPYYNEAGYERQRSTTNGQENARMYNEMVVLKLVQAMGALVRSPPRVWATETHDHFRARGKGFTERLEYWSKVSANKMPAENVDQKQSSEGQIGVDVNVSETPGAPASDGECKKSGEKSHGERETFHDEAEKSHEEREQIDCDTQNEFELPQFPLLPASRGFCLTLKSLISTFRTTLKRLELMDSGAADTLQPSVSKTEVEQMHKEPVESCCTPSSQEKERKWYAVSENQIGTETPIVSETPTCPSEQENSTISGTSGKSSTHHNLDTNSSQLKSSNTETNTNNSQLKSSNTPSLVESAGRGKVARSNSREIVHTKGDLKEVIIGETGNILSRTNSKVDMVSNKSKSGTPDQTRLGTRNNSINRSEMVEPIDTIYGSNVISESMSVHVIKGDGKKKSLDSVNNNNNKI